MVDSLYGMPYGLSLRWLCVQSLSDAILPFYWGIKHGVMILISEVKSERHSREREREGEKERERERERESWAKHLLSLGIANDHVLTCHPSCTELLQSCSSWLYSVTSITPPPLGFARWFVPRLYIVYFRISTCNIHMTVPTPKSLFCYIFNDAVRISTSPIWPLYFSECYVNRVLKSILGSRLQTLFQLVCRLNY